VAGGGAQVVKKKKESHAGPRWLTPIIRRQRSGGSQFKASPRQIVLENLSQKPITKKD
jgi:hypothetical protein